MEVPNLTEVSVPEECTTEELIIELKKQLDAEVYTLGELIVPQKFEKITMIDNKLEKEEIEVKGRKIPFDTIRQKINIKHEKYMKIHSDEELVAMNNDEIRKHLNNINELKKSDDSCSIEELRKKLSQFERTRHLMLWHDGSTLSNHGHLLMMVCVIYDPAIYYTDKEYFELYNKNINIQALVERPNLYLLARCPSNDQQIMYGDERMEDIASLNIDIPTPSGIPIKDVMRVFKGDAPAAQFEAGQQKGGHFFCWACPIKSYQSSDLISTLNAPHMSLQDRINKVKESVTSQNKLDNKRIKLYSNLDKSALIDELHQRKLKFEPKASIKDLQIKLQNEMHGIQRLPALLYNFPNSTLNDLNLSTYEILCTEPLHDVSNHTKNLFNELPWQFQNPFKETLQSIINSSFNNKDAKNSADYRKSLLVVTNWFLEKNKNIPTVNFKSLENITIKLLTTLAEIQELLYLPDNERNISKVLRLINITFIHGMLLTKFLDKNKSKLKDRKDFGVYYHSLIGHAPIQFRLFSGRTSNTEKEEATFSCLKRFTKNASNHHPDNVITNSFIRHQAREILKDNEVNQNKKKESFISSIYNPIKIKLKNSIISFEWIKNYPYEYQALLERQADFLLEDIWWRESDDGVEFHDTDTHTIPTDLQLHHFRSYTIKDETEYLNQCWKECLINRNKLIPAQKIKIYDSSNSTFTVTYLKTLAYFHPILINNSNNDNNNIITSVETPESYEKNIESSKNNESHNQSEDVDFSFDISEIHNESNKNNETTHSNVDSSIKDLIITPTDTSNNQTATQTTPLQQQKTTSTPVTKLTDTINENTNLLTLTATPLQHKKHTSTPVKAPKLKNIKQKEQNVIFIKPVDPFKDNAPSKSSAMLITILGEHHLITEYDVLRKRIKKTGNQQYISDYKLLIAQIEVKLNIEYHTLKEKLKKTELLNLKNNSALSTLPSEQNQKHYYDLLKKLKLIKVVKAQLQL